MTEKKKQPAKIPEVVAATDLNALFEGTLMMELGEVPLKNPRGEIREAETDVGEMSLVEKKLYSLAMHYGKLAAMVAAKAEYEADTDDEHTNLIRVATRSKEISDAVLGLMWVLIRERLNLSGVSIGVRDNFHVSSWKGSANRGSTIEKLIKSLGGIRIDPPEED